MNEEEFEQILRKKIGEEAIDKVNRVWLHFYGISLEESAAMFLSPDSETRALFEEGYDMTRELDILYHASALMKQAGLKKGHDGLFDYCVAKEDAYAEKVHAANLEERIQNAEGVEEQK